jgi:hypothetical protein
MPNAPDPRVALGMIDATLIGQKSALNPCEFHIAK